MTTALSLRFQLGDRERLMPLPLTEDEIVALILLADSQDRCMSDLIASALKDILVEGLLHDRPASR